MENSAARKTHSIDLTTIPNSVFLTEACRRELTRLEAINDDFRFLLQGLIERLTELQRPVKTAPPATDEVAE